MTEGTQTNIHDCIISVTERGATIVLNSKPSLYETDIFDGDYLEDNIYNTKDIPSVMGIYKCKIQVEYSKYWTDCGYEHDVQSSIDDIVKMDVNLSL